MLVIGQVVGKFHSSLPESCLIEIPMHWGTSRL